MTNELPINEITETWQSEGPHAGRRAVLIRLGYCNHACAWCAHPGTCTDPDATCPPTPVADIIDRATTAPLYVIAGGEPMLHQKHWAFTALLGGLRPGDVHMETNGSIVPAESTIALVKHFTVSPKLTDNYDRTSALVAFADLASEGRAAFTFTATGAADLDHIANTVDVYRIPETTVWVAPGGDTADTMIKTHRALADTIRAHGWNTSTRLHTLLAEGE